MNNYHTKDKKFYSKNVISALQENSCKIQETKNEFLPVAFLTIL
jgi:hypothetical protein